MTTYKEIRGSQIEAVATDPSNPVEGQVWYNTTSNVLKGSALTTAGAFASTNSLNTAHGGAGCTNQGTYTSALCWGGAQSGGSPDFTDKTESWNGTNWTEVADLNKGRNGVSGAGVSNTSALAYAGSSPGAPSPNGATESWNGTSWTEVNDMNTDKSGMATGTGTKTSALAAGGYDEPANASTGQTEEWNGTCWSETADLNTSRRQMLGCGADNNSSIVAGGWISPPSGSTVNVETWNGTSWTEVGNLNQAKYANGGFGIATAALSIGGLTPSITSNVEQWNGSTWTETTNYPANSRNACGGGATGGSALAYDGENNPDSAVTTSFTWTGPGVAVTRTFTDS